MANAEIRKEMKAEKIYFWKLADKIGVCEMTIIRWFRKELPQDKREQIISAISEIKETIA